MVSEQVIGIKSESVIVFTGISRLGNRELFCCSELLNLQTPRAGVIQILKPGRDSARIGDGTFDLIGWNEVAPSLA